MHELGIIVHIAKTLDQVAAENELKKIGSVTLDIGEVSGIVPEYLTECWEFYRKKNPLIAECEMKIESLPAVTICEDCQKTYETVTYGRQCPHCGSYETYLVTGNECSIKEIEAGGGEPYNNLKMDMEGKTRTVFPSMSVLRLWKSDS